MDRTVLKDLTPAPADGVTRIKFNATGTRLLVTTWSGTVSVHNSESALREVESEVPSNCAILHGTWTGNGDDTIAVGTLDGKVFQAESSLASWTEIGRHEQGAARGVVFDSMHRQLASGGWDGQVKFWDSRSNGSKTISQTDLGGKCFGLANCGPQAVIAITSTRRVVIIDFRKTSEFTHDKIPAALAYQLRGIDANTAGTRYVVGSTEGKVLVEWPLDPERGYSFKCHRSDGLAFPVNAVAHNQKYRSFATGGGDGAVAIWDGEKKKRLVQYSRESTSIASLDFSPDSHMLATAISYTFEEGEKDSPPDHVYIRSVLDNEIKTASLP